MKIYLLLALYVAALFWGCRRMKGPHRNLHRLWYGCILGWCAYLNFCGITNTPHISVSSLYIVFFQPAGEFIIHWLGG